MSDTQMATQICALCGKTLDAFSCSWDVYFASGRNRSAISGFGCGSCGSMICSECREKTVKWSVMDGFDKARCPKCKGAFPPIRIYAEREWEEKELSQAIRNLKMSLSVLGASPGNPPSQLGDHFVELGEPGLESLLAALDSAKGITVAGFAEAARVLADRGETRAAAKLAAMLVGDSKSRAVLDAYRSASIEPLTRLDPEGARRLLEAIVTGEKEPLDLRVQAAERLGSLGRPESVVPLIQALADIKWSRAKLVAAAAASLGRLGDARASAPLLSALKISDPGAKAMIVEALGKLGDAGAAAAIGPYLKSGHPGLRQAAAVALDRLGWRPADENEKKALAKSFPAQQERFCFSCDRPVGDAKACPRCLVDLMSKPKSPALAGFLGFLFGNLIGVLLLAVMALVGAIFKYDMDTRIRAGLYGLTAISAWQGMKAKLATARDLAVLKPKAGSRRSAGPDVSP